jgi:hypothetical protein
MYFIAAFATGDWASTVTNATIANTVSSYLGNRCSSQFLRAINFYLASHKRQTPLFT